MTVLQNFPPLLPTPAPGCLDLRCDLPAGDCVLSFIGVTSFRMCVLGVLYPLWSDLLPKVCYMYYLESSVLLVVTFSVGGVGCYTYVLLSWLSSRSDPLSLVRKFLRCVSSGWVTLLPLLKRLVGPAPPQFGGGSMYSPFGSIGPLNFSQICLDKIHIFLSHKSNLKWKLWVNLVH